MASASSSELGRTRTGNEAEASKEDDDDDELLLRALLLEENSRGEENLSEMYIAVAHRESTVRNRRIERPSAAISTKQSVCVRNDRDRKGRERVCFLLLQMGNRASSDIRRNVIKTGFQGKEKKKRRKEKRGKRRAQLTLFILCPLLTKMTVGTLNSSARASRVSRDASWLSLSLSKKAIR
jgi:hypothetical protein